MPDPGIVLVDMLHDPAPGHFQDGLLSDSLSRHQVEIQMGVLLEDFLVRRQMFGELFARHATGLENGFLARKMGIDLATQLAQDFREGFGNRM